MYDIIPQASFPSNNQSQSTQGPHVDGVIGSISASIVNQVSRKLGQLAIIDNPASMALETTSTTFSQSTDVNLVQTSKSNQTIRRNNRHQCKKNAPTKQSEPNAKEPNAAGNEGKKKIKFPCMACKENHFTRECLHLTDVQKYVE